MRTAPLAGIAAAAALGLALTLTLASASARAAGEPAAAGKVTFVSGEAARKAPKAEKLTLGAPVFENDTLETQGRTRLEITLRDQSVVRVGPRSTVVLSSAVFGRSLDDRKVAARLIVGDMWAKVTKAVGGDSTFQVQTANAVAGVRGTTFRVDARSDRSVVVKVYAGTVAVAGGAVPRPKHEGAGEGKAEGKKPRTQVPGPSEVSREQWERIVGKMMQVKVSADGSPADPEPFKLAGAGADDFEAWNRERDGGEE